ncbi:MAG: rhodanese-like domain-containing protein, partial [Methanotrichaceae archaeon]|nr:rhodanese-like domain-containing protein [Methanotrichaceae archaeon]
MIKYWKETLQIIWHAFVQENPKWSEITVDELYERLESEPPALLVDVRSSEDFNGGYGHLPGAKLIPMLELESRLDELEEYKTHEIVTMCPGGG